MSEGSTFPGLWDAMAAAGPDAIAVIQGGRRLRWGDFERRARGLGTSLFEAGLPHRANVAQCLYSGVEYLESVYGCMKASYSPVNTNYRYTPAELADIWGRADVAAVIFDVDFAEKIDVIRADLSVTLWVAVGDNPPSWAVPYETLAEAAVVQWPVPWRPSGDDLCLLYTGGTTGAPKAVMWAQEDLRVAIGSLPALGNEPVRLLPASPMMHGVGLFTAFLALNEHGSVICLSSKSYDPIELLDTIERERVNIVTLVGDAFARPVVKALSDCPDRWDISSLSLLSSSGMFLSGAVKESLFRHAPGLVIADGLGASELVSAASAVSSATNMDSAATFSLSSQTKVVDETFRPVEPGSGVIGRLVMIGNIPRGYYGDPEATAVTFPVVDGIRYALGGDYVTVESDGSVSLLGRGSSCINTAGEKVYPDEVEAVLRNVVDLEDCAVIGVPDERYGEVVAAVVVPKRGRPALGMDEIDTLMRPHLAGYKLPRRLIVLPSLDRAANGKLNLKALRATALGARRRDFGTTVE